MTLKEWLDGRKGTRPGPFKPHAVYLRDGDFINVYWEDERCYTERLTDDIELFKAMSDSRVVGCRILKLIVPGEEQRTGPSALDHVRKTVADLEAIDKARMDQYRRACDREVD